MAEVADELVTNIEDQLAEAGDPIAAATGKNGQMFSILAVKSIMSKFFSQQCLLYMYSLLPNFVEWFFARIFATRCCSHMGFSVLYSETKLFPYYDDMHY